MKKTIRLIKCQKKMLYQIMKITKTIITNRLQTGPLGGSLQTQKILLERSKTL